MGLTDPWLPPDNGPDVTQLGGSAVAGSANLRGPAPGTPNQPSMGGPTAAAQLTPGMMGGAVWSGPMDQNKEWSQQWQQAWNRYTQAPTEDNARVVQLIQQGFSRDQINAALYNGGDIANNAVNTYNTGQANNGRALQYLIQQSLSSDPGLAALDSTRAILGLQGGLQGQMTDLQRQQLRANTDISLQKLGLQSRGIEDDKAYAKQLKGFADQQYNIETGSAKSQYNDNLASLYSDATARGAVTTGGTRRHQSKLGEDLFFQMSGSNLTKDRSYAQSDRMLKQADLAAQNVGLDRQGYLNALNFGLQQIGLSSSMDALDLMERANSTDAEKAAAAQGIINNFVGLAQQNPDLLQQIAAGQGLKGVDRGSNSNMQVPQDWGIGKYVS